MTPCVGILNCVLSKMRSTDSWWSLKHTCISESGIPRSMKTHWHSVQKVLHRTGVLLPLADNWCQSKDCSSILLNFQDSLSQEAQRLNPDQMGICPPFMDGQTKNGDQVLITCRETSTKDTWNLWLTQEITLKYKLGCRRSLNREELSSKICIWQTDLRRVWLALQWPA